MKIIPFGEQAVRLIFGDRIDPALQAEMSRFMYIVDQHPFPGLIEYVPAYTNIAFYYDPLTVLTAAPHPNGMTAQQTVIDYLTVCYTTHMTKTSGAKSSAGRTIRIPVCYGGEFGPDLASVASYHQINVEEVIKQHCAPKYLVYMLGFAPGFPFLGGLPEGLATPRRESPRLKIAAGSVGIAGKQTGVYPLQSPGGWQIIGRTPIDLFTPDRESPTLLHAGDTIQFESITKDVYWARRGER